MPSETCWQYPYTDTCVTPSLTPGTGVAPPPPDLAQTGSDIGIVLTWGAVALFIGIVVLAAVTFYERRYSK